MLLMSGGGPSYRIINHRDVAQNSRMTLLQACEQLITLLLLKDISFQTRGGQTVNLEGGQDASRLSMAEREFINKSY